MDEAPKSFRFIRNLSWNALGQVGGWAVSFMLTPYLIHRMGIELYGLYLLLYLASGYMMLLSFGTSYATTIKTAKLLASKNDRGLRQLYARAGTAHLLGLSAGAAALILAAPFCVRFFFNVPAPMQDLAVLVVRCAAVGTIFLGFFQLGNATLQGLQRFDLYNALAILQSTLLPAGVALIFALGHGLAQASMWFVALNALAAAAAFFICRRLFSEIRIGHEGPGLPMKPFAQNSAGLWLAQCAWMVVYQFDKLFVGRHLSLSDLTLYAVPAGVLMRLQAVPANIYSVAMPMVSELQGPSAQEVSRMYLKSVRAVLWATLPILAVLFGLMPQFLTLWLGPEFGGKSVWPARMLVLGHAIALLDYMPRMSAYACGKPLYPTTALWSQAAVAVIAWTWLVPRYQILGAAIGFLLSQALPLPFLLWKVHGNIVGVPMKRYLLEGLSGPLASAALTLAFVLSLHSRVDGWGRLLALSATAACLYYLSAWQFMSAEDKNLARSYLRRV